MRVICVGMNKTGTKSITKALRHLEFAVFDWEEQIFDFMDHWLDVFQNGVKPDVKRVYRNADAVVDIPGNLFYEEILESFPEFKVILSEREEDSWVKSVTNHFENMVVSGSCISYILSMLSPTAGKITYIQDSLLTALFGSLNPKSTYVFRKRHRIHNQRVKSIVPHEKLLVYNVKQGWKPLCDFLDCTYPAIPFPHENIKAEITKMPLDMTRTGRQIKRELQNSVFVIFGLLVMVLAVIMAICISY